MSGPYVKVFGSILNSSVWCADIQTRIVWITLLLLADADGNVWAAVPGLARQAGVPVEACRQALEFLGSPDHDSRTPDHEGRRIVAIPGGWRVLNTRKYREMQTDGQRAASERARRYRERHTSVTQRDDRDASRPSRTEGEGEVEVEVETEAQISAADAAAAAPRPSKRHKPDNDHNHDNGAGKVEKVDAIEIVDPGAWASDWVARLVEIWGHHGTIAHGKLGTVLKPLKGRWPLEDVERALAAFLAAGNGRFGAVKFVETAADWIQGRPATGTRDAASLEAARRFAGGGGGQ